MQFSLVALLAAACLLRCSDVPPTPSRSGAGIASEVSGSSTEIRTSEAATLSRTYVDAVESFTTRAEKERWGKMLSALQSDFDDRCGDSFCEGEYSEIEPLFFRCSVAKDSGVLKRCVWVFGESNWDLDVRTGAITIDKGRVTACNIPVTGTAAALANAIHSLDDRLPGTHTTINTVLQGCL